MKGVLVFFSWCFKIYVALVMLLTLLVFYPFLYITLLRVSWRKWSFPINVCWSVTVRILCLVWVHYTRRVKLPKGPYLIVSNHTSYYDIFLMYSLFPRNRFLFLGKSDILSYPIVNIFFKRLNIPVYRNDRMKAAKSFLQAKQALKTGWSLVIFPEGGIPDDHLPTMVSFKDGAFKLAKSAEVPIVALTFLDHYHLFSDVDQKRGYAHPGVSRIHMHDVISVEQQKNLSESALSALVFDTIAAPLRERGLMK